MGRKTVPDTLTLAEAARKMSMSQRWVRVRLETGDLRGVNHGRRIAVFAESINEWNDAHELTVPGRKP